jgi:ribonucleoside-diphosphate reductase beta chain
MRKLSFNVYGDDSLASRKIFKGNPTGLVQLSSVRYDWALKIYKQMRANFWIPQKYDLTQDKKDLSKLTSYELQALKNTLSFLIFLDSLQTSNIPELMRVTTAPEVKLCFAEQTSQEGMHSESYQYILESLFELEERNEVYNGWKNIEFLKHRCEFIAKYYDEFIVNPDCEISLIRALIANYILEGVYFFNGFNFFYNLASRHLLSGCADIFKAINKDEETHVALFQRILRQLVSEGCDITQDFTELMSKAVQLELSWCEQYSAILGITYKSTLEYTHYLANKRCKAAGVPEMYPTVKNPYQHLSKAADTGSEATSKTNYFESGVTSYQMAASVSGWDSF